MKNRQFLMLGGVAMALAALFTTISLHEILAQEANNSTQSNQTRTEPLQLNGSVNIQQQTNRFIQDNLRVTFANALETAQAQVQNGTAISGSVAVVQGYLVYIFKVANFGAETSRIVIVDAGNGSVLYTSGDMPLHIGDLGGYGCSGGGRGHEAFGNHWSNYDRGTTSDSTRSNESFRTGVVASPVIGV